MTDSNNMQDAIDEFLKNKSQVVKQIADEKNLDENLAQETLEKCLDFYGNEKPEQRSEMFDYIANVAFSVIHDKATLDFQNNVDKMLDKKVQEVDETRKVQLQTLKDMINFMNPRSQYN